MPSLLCHCHNEFVQYRGRVARHYIAIRTEETGMYIGVGAVVVILVVLLLIGVLR
jgi:hypothetical protein